MPDAPEHDELVSNNEAWVQRRAFDGLEARPTRQTAVVACMDTRIDPLGILGLSLGEAHVLRNAGGRVSDDAIRSLVVSAAALGTRTAIVIQHTRCGMLGTTNEAIREQVAAVVEGDAQEAHAIDFLPIAELEESVRHDVERLRTSPLLPADYRVLGYLYDVDSGRITPVD